MKIKRIIALALLLPCLLVGCNQPNQAEQTTPSTTAPKETTSEATTPEETTLETIPPSCTEDPLPKNTMQLTHVTISAGDSPSEQTALSELTEYLEKRSITVAEGGFPIDLYIDITLEEDAYCVEATLEGKHQGMDIRGGNGRGVLYGVYGFLEEYAGLRAYTPTLEIYPTEGDITIEDGMMIEFHPVFEMRVNDWYRWNVGNSETIPWCVKNGVNMIDGWWASWQEELGGAWDYGGYFVHTLGSLTETGGGTTANPCLTNPDNLAKAQSYRGK